MRMETMKLLLLLFAMLCLTTATRASTCPDGAPAILKIGENSPCEGVLMSKADALKLAGHRARVKKVEAQKDQLVVKLVAAEQSIAFEKTKCDERVTSCDAQVKTLSDRLSEAGRVEAVVEWYAQPLFVAVVTAVVVAAVAVPITYIVASR